MLLYDDAFIVNIKDKYAIALEPTYLYKNEPLNAIFWLMRDTTLPPVLKLEGLSLASVLDATLATKITSAENFVPMMHVTY